MIGDTRIRIITIAGAVGVVVLILELVRRRKLKEEYSVLWVLTSLVVLVLAVWFGALEGITKLIGATLPSSTLFFFGLLFVLVLSLHFSVRISSLERLVTTLVQEIALMTAHEPDPGASDPPSPSREETKPLSEPVSGPPNR